MAGLTSQNAACRSTGPIRDRHLAIQIAESLVQAPAVVLPFNESTTRRAHRRPSVGTRQQREEGIRERCRVAFGDQNRGVTVENALGKGSVLCGDDGHPTGLGLLQDQPLALSVAVRGRDAPEQEDVGFVHQPLHRRTVLGTDQRDVVHDVLFANEVLEGLPERSVADDRVAYAWKASAGFRDAADAILETLLLDHPSDGEDVYASVRPRRTLAEREFVRIQTDGQCPDLVDRATELSNPPARVGAVDRRAVEHTPELFVAVGAVLSRPPGEVVPVKADHQGRVEQLPRQAKPVADRTEVRMEDIESALPAA